MPRPPLLDCSPVRQARQRVSERQLLKEAVLLLKFPVQRHDALPYFSSRQQLFRVKGLGKIFIGASLEACYHF